MRIKKNSFLFALLMLCALLLPGCTMQELFVAENDEETEVADQLARSFIEAMKKGDIDGLASISTPGLAAPEVREALASLASDLDKGDIIIMETIKSNILTQYFSKTARTLLGYQIEMEEGWLKAVVVVDSVEGQEEMKVSTVYIEPIAGPMSEIYAFDIYNAPTANYIVLAITLCIPLFIIYTISVCLRMRRHIKFPVLWLFFILVGVGTFSFDWSSGQMGFKLFSALLMGGGAYKDTIYGPWVMSFSFPLGAVAFFIYLSRTLERKKASEAKDAAPASRCGLEG